MAEEFRVGPARVLVADAITDPPEDWTDLGLTRGDVFYRLLDGAVALGRADQSGKTNRADGVYLVGRRAQARCPMTDSEIAKLAEVCPGGVHITNAGKEALGFGSGFAGLSGKAFAVVPEDEYTEGSPWWDSDMTHWLPNGVATVMGEWPYGLPEGEDALAGAVMEVEIGSLGADQTLSAGLEDIGGIGELHRFLSSGNVGVLGLDFLWEAGDGLNPKVGSTGTHTRASTATYWDENGVLQVAASGELRNSHYIGGDRKTLLEGQRTNKCQRNYLHGGAITGWTKSGDAAATLTAVTDAAELAGAGLGTVVSDSYVLKLDNSAGSTNALARSSGTAGNTNDHTVSVYWRGSGRGTVRLWNSSGAHQTVPTSYERISSTLTAVAADNLTVIAEAGAVVYFVLSQLEEGSFVSSVILNATSGSVTREADNTYFPLPTLQQTPGNQTVYADFTNLMLAGVSKYFRFFEIGTVTLDGSAFLAYTNASSNQIVCGSKTEAGGQQSSLISSPILSPATDYEFRANIPSAGSVEWGVSEDQATEGIGSLSPGTWDDTYNLRRLSVAMDGVGGNHAFMALGKVALTRQLRSLTELRAA